MIGEAIVSRAPLSRSEEHTSELQSRPHLVCRLLLEKKKRALAQAGRKAAGAPRYGRRTERPEHRQGSVSRRPWRSLNARSCLTAIRAFFFNDPATTEIYTLSLHDALPI